MVKKEGRNWKRKTLRRKDYGRMERREKMRKEIKREKKE